MSHWLILLQLVITVAAMVAAIVFIRLDPAIALVAGSLYLGVVCGLGLEETTEAVANGFGALMAEVGLVIGFGVLIGAVMAASGTLQRIADLVLRLVGPKRSPYALGLTCGTVFPSIYADVTIVVLAPLVRRLARQSGRGIAPLAGTFIMGVQGGLLMVVPGAAALAAAGTLDIGLGVMLVWGVPFLIVGLLIAAFLYGKLVDRIWDKSKHELVDQSHLLERDGLLEGGTASAGSPAAAAIGTFEKAGNPRPTSAAGVVGNLSNATPASGADISGARRDVEDSANQWPLFVALLPLWAPLMMIMSYTLSKALGNDNAVLGFIGNPIVALLTGLLVAIGLALRTLGRPGVEKAVANGAGTSGVILLFTAVAGSLGEVINLIGVGDMLAGLFSANATVPVLLTWLVAAALRLAQGSASVSLIAGTALLAPIVGDLGVPAAVIALAAAAGAMFGGHVTDNSFWMFQTLFGLTIRGTFIAYTGALAVFSLVGLGMVTLVNFVI